MFNVRIIRHSQTRLSYPQASRSIFSPFFFKLFYHFQPSNDELYNRQTATVYMSKDLLYIVVGILYNTHKEVYALLRVLFTYIIKNSKWYSRREKVRLNLSFCCCPVSFLFFFFFFLRGEGLYDDIMNNLASATFYFIYII